MIFSLHSLISKLCGNPRGMATHFKDVLKSPSIGSPLGPHSGVLPCGGCGGCSPPVHPMGPQISSCGPSRQCLPQGQGGWHPSNMMNSPGMNCGCHHPGASGPPVAHGPPTMPFQSGVVNTHQGQRSSSKSYALDTFAKFWSGQ